MSMISCPKQNIPTAPQGLSSNFASKFNSFIYSASQWTGFYMIATSVIKELNKFGLNLLTSISPGIIRRHLVGKQSEKH